MSKLAVILKSSADRMFKICISNAMAGDLDDAFIESFFWHVFLSSLVNKVINYIFKRII